MLYTIATAGHIDHGKTSLVRALTGMDPDRLPEEKAREMTIELGFAWFLLADGSEVAVVDVPGHEKFVDAMITGVGAIDSVVFVVAADDGWMPQSQEHLEILDYLNTKRGLIAITKTDMVKPEWLELVTADVAERVRGTFLDGARFCRFSAVGSSGLEDIRLAIGESLSTIEQRADLGLPRMYVDRVFSMTGHGTVVTGTMRDGVFNVGDDILVVPQRLHGKIKAIQAHKKLRDRSQLGARAALNITGVSYNDLHRGCAVIRTGEYEGSRSIAARIRISRHANIKLTHRRSVKLLLGTAKVNATAIVFQDDMFEPGSEGICEFRLDSPALARVGDRFILRLPAPDVLLGGGEVIATDCADHPRSDKRTRKRLESIRVDEVESVVLHEISERKAAPVASVCRSVNRSRTEISSVIEKMVQSGQLVKRGELVYGASEYARLADKLTETVIRFHERHPARKGIPKAELISKLDADLYASELAIQWMIEDGRLSVAGALVHSAGFQPRLKPEQERLKGDVLRMFRDDPSNPPSRRQIEGKSFAMRDVVAFMIDSGEIVELPEGLVLLGADFERITNGIVETIKSKGQLGVADVRDLFGFSRKYGVPILEKLDSMGITKRIGDRRVLAE
jgi:selenocysteine-specific elongation factor